MGGDFSGKEPCLKALEGLIDRKHAAAGEEEEGEKWPAIFGHGIVPEGFCKEAPGGLGKTSLHGMFSQFEMVVGQIFIPGRMFPYFRALQFAVKPQNLFRVWF